ncbi:N-acetylglucosamine related transporter NagX [Geitlerinema sp. FC II]|nr:heparan-alpha-glucosaminide N-acetyltransferase domain-containing protein [Geitlerinema sp. CS-897]PPT05505.1 N-acetylglucosamine related transporter NagX [Geitlerinema sp. FC II]
MNTLVRSPRLASLDVFRGLAIAAMILVNNPGSWKYTYSPLKHAEWHGFTPTDLVFPAFLFIVGVAMAFSFAKYFRFRRFPFSVYGRILWRSLVLFALGLLLNGFYTYEWDTIRIMGVLQRISLAYLLASLVVLRLKPLQQMMLAAIVLVAYHLVTIAVPVPGFGVGDLSREGNLVGYLDRLILGQPHLLRDGVFDPEGLLSTLPATVTVLLGYFTGDWLRRQPTDSQTSVGLIVVGIVGAIVGSLWGSIFPLNKSLWTSSYVVYSAGWCWLLLAILYQVVEVWRWRSWAFPLQVMGRNAIVIFVGSGFLARILLYTSIDTGEEPIALQAWIYQRLFQSWAGEFGGSIAYAIANVVLWGAIAYFLYRRRWFIKVRS